jgi:putative PIG3 family NAD(P)H quinone oxidoreductase
MQAISLRHFGGPEVLTPSELPQPIPGPDQLLVHVKACALNRADLLQRRGKYPPPPGESDILGLEIAGQVVGMGSNVTGFGCGEKVFGLVGSGGYAEYCLLDQGMAMQIPENFSYAQAAAIPEAFLTAQEALFSLGQLSQYETVLIHAGGSGVGSAALQLAAQVNANVFTTTSTADKYERIKAFGLPTIINYKQQDVAAEILRLTHDKGVNVIIDFIGASYLPAHLRLLQDAGRLVFVGLMGGHEAQIDLSTIHRKRLQLKGLIMRGRSMAEKRLITHYFKERWLPLFSQGMLQPVIDSIFPFKDANLAHEYMEKNLNVGKIILSLA